MRINWTQHFYSQMTKYAQKKGAFAPRFIPQNSHHSPGLSEMKPVLKGERIRRHSQSVYCHRRKGRFPRIPPGGGFNLPRVWFLVRWKGNGKYFSHFTN